MDACGNLYASALVIMFFVRCAEHFNQFVPHIKCLLHVYIVYPYSILTEANPPNKHTRTQNNGAQQLASEATVYIMLEDVNDEIPLFTEREQETVLEGEPIGTKVTQVNAIDKDGTFPNNQVSACTQRHGAAESEMPRSANAKKQRTFT